MLTQGLSDTSSSVDLALETVIQEMKVKDFESTKSSVKDLTSKQNAYTSAYAPVDDRNKWNMITYKTGKKSSL